MHLLAAIDPKAHTGSIRSVTPIERGVESRLYPQSEATVEWFNANGQPLSSRTVRIKLSSCSENREHRHGMIDAILRRPEQAAEIRLKLQGQEVDRARSVGGNDPLGAAEMAARGTTLAWQGKRGVWYTIQTSSDGGKTWDTISVSQTATNFTLEKRNYPGVKQLRVRIIATDGFRSTATVHDANL